VVKDITSEIRRTIALGFLGAEVVSASLTFISHTPGIAFLILTLLNLFGYLILRWLISVESKKPHTRASTLAKIRPATGRRVIAISAAYLIFGGAVLWWSQNYYPKWYALGVSLVVWVLCVIACRKWTTTITENQRTASTSALRIVWIRNRVRTYGLFYVAPLLLDLHYMVLALRSETYFIALGIYFCGVLFLFSYNLFRISRTSIAP
jgi:hypothetical protein